MIGQINIIINLNIHFQFFFLFNFSLNLSKTLCSTLESIGLYLSSVTLLKHQQASDSWLEATNGHMLDSLPSVVEVMLYSLDREPL